MGVRRRRGASRGRDLASAGPAWSTPRGNGYVRRDNLLLAHCPPQKRRLRSIFQDQLVLPRRHIVQIEGGLLGTEDVVRRHPPTICALEFLRVGGMLDGQDDPLCGREDRDEAIIERPRKLLSWDLALVELFQRTVLCVDDPEGMEILAFRSLHFDERHVFLLGGYSGRRNGSPIGGFLS